MITKALINQGGSKKENYIYQILSGKFQENDLPISSMWRSLDDEIKRQLVIVLNDVCDLGIKESHSEQQTIESIIDYMAKQSGRLTFMTYLSDDEVSVMTQEDYEATLNDAIAEKHALLINKETF